MRSAKIMTVCFVTALGLLALCGSAQAADGMVSYWTFDEGSGDIAHDSANGNHGTIYGATWTTGQVDGALSFDGVDDYVDCGDPADNSLDIGNAATIEVWVKFVASPTRYNPFVSKDVGGGWQDKWFFDYSGDFRRTEFHINKATGPDWIGGSPWTPALNQWYHLAVVKSGNNYAFYRNGAPDGTDSTTVTVPDVDFALLIGKAEAFSFNGLIDEVAIYNRALTGSEVWDSYVSVKAVYLLHSLAQKVITLNLQKGIANSLDAKLYAALQALDDLNENNDVAAINALQAFINAVEAQRGNKIPEADADALIADAQYIIDLLESV